MSNIWCRYCHSNIEENEETFQDEQGRVYHKECYEQMNTFTDDFDSTYSYNEFGDIE